MEAKNTANLPASGCRHEGKSGDDKRLLRWIRQFSSTGKKFSIWPSRL